MGNWIGGGRANVKEVQGQGKKNGEGDAEDFFAQTGMGRRVCGDTTHVYRKEWAFGHRKEKARVSENILLATLNIRSEMVRGMVVALWALRQGNVDVGVLQDTKLEYGIHVQQGERYSVWATEADIRHQGGISIVLRKDAGW